MNTTKPQPKRGTPDFQLLILTLLLVGFGLIMVFSSSSSLAVFNEKFNNDPSHFTKRQVAFAVLGTLVMFVAMNINYKSTRSYSYRCFSNLNADSCGDHRFRNQRSHKLV